jgi:nicotinate-nucleotide pyrophosphorylase (carboxylating)
MFTEAEADACKRLIELALPEDLCAVGDLTSLAIIPADLQGQAVFVARKDGVLAGLPAAVLVATAIDPHLVIEPIKRDGDALTRGDRIAIIRGPMRGLLAAERTALNFMQHLSGVATQTRRYVDQIKELPCRILDTRKTLPGWRLLEKYAVRQGGGHNHRVGLYDGVLIKDNHLAAMGGGRKSVAEAVRLARQATTGIPVEVEVDSLEQLKEALRIGPDIVLLDNMTLEQMRDAVAMRNRLAPKVQLEASGGITLERLRDIALTGVDRISVGALTHSAPALDIALDYQS